MGYNDTDRDHPHPWKNALWEARRGAREALSAIPDDVPRHSILHAPKEQVVAHRYLLDYHSHLETHVEVFKEEWEEVLFQRKLPPRESTVDVESGIYGEYDAESALYELEWITQDISLATLREVWKEGNEVVYSVRVDGQPREQRREVYHLSPRAISICLSQLDKCLHQLGWVPDPAEGEYRAGEDEVLVHE